MHTNDSPAIEIRSLRKTYASGQTALTGVDLTIERGEFFGLLGPNGAGKSTLISCMATITNPTSGSINVLGHDVAQEPLVTKRLLGVVPQEISFDSFFNVQETLEQQSGFFGLRHNEATIDELLEALSLADKRKVNTRALSGGMKRRLLVAKALVHRPPVLILDEPTAGVDVELRQTLYAYIKKINAAGVTVLLTTHYLEEAELLCNRIAIINNGNIIALDTTKNLLMKLGSERRLILATKERVTVIPETLLPFHPSLGTSGHEITLHFSSEEYDRVFRALAGCSIDVSYFKIEEENLQDIFIKLTSPQNHVQ